MRKPRPAGRGDALDKLPEWETHPLELNGWIPLGYNFWERREITLAGEQGIAQGTLRTLVEIPPRAGIPKQWFKVGDETPPDTVSWVKRDLFRFVGDMWEHVRTEQP